MVLNLLPQRCPCIKYCQWRTQGGEWGVRTPPTFQKVGPRDSHKNIIKLVGGGRVGQICQEVVSKILQKKAKNGFSSVGSKVLVSKKCLKTAGRGIISQC